MVNLVVDHVVRFGSIMRATATLNVLLMQNNCDPVSPKAVKSLLEQLGGIYLAIPKLPQGNSNPKSKWARAHWGFSLQILLFASQDAFGSAEEANDFLTVKYHDTSQLNTITTTMGNMKNRLSLLKMDQLTGRTGPIGHCASSLIS